MHSVASTSLQLVAWLALIRCAGVFVAVARQGLRLNRAVVTEWGWVETLASPEPFLMAVFARSEEQMMLAHFGAPYQLYQRSTGMLVPRVRVPHNGQSAP